MQEFLTQEQIKEKMEAREKRLASLEQRVKNLMSQQTWSTYGELADAVPCGVGDLCDVMCRIWNHET